MKILHSESSLNWGGQEYRTLLEILYLIQHGHDVWLACQPKSKILEYAQRYHINNIILVDFSNRWRIDIAIKLCYFCLKSKIQILNSHSSKDSFLLLLANFCGIPLIRSRQITNPIKSYFSYKYGCSHILATAQVIKDMFVSKKIAESKVTVIGEGVDLQEFNPTLDSTYLRRAFSVKEDDLVIINIGMIRSDKGQKYYLEAAKLLFEKHKNLKFFLIGTSTTHCNIENDLKSTIKQNNMQSYFFMPGYREDVAYFMHLADIVVVSSIGTEAQSRIVPQAFATKRAVICTNVGGLTELVVDQKTGLVVEPKNAAAIADAICLLEEDSKLREKLSINAYNYAVEHLSFDSMMKKTLNLYSSILK